MTAAVRTALLPEEDPELRRWLIAGTAVLAVHAGLVFWLMHKLDMNAAGAPPAAIIIDLPPMEVSPPAETPPEVTEGPQMKQADPEEVEEPQTMAIPELPPAPKPAVVLMSRRNQSQSRKKS